MSSQRGYQGPNELRDMLPGFPPSRRAAGMSQFDQQQYESLNSHNVSTRGGTGVHNHISNIRQPPNRETSLSPFQTNQPISRFVPPQIDPTCGNRYDSPYSPVDFHGSRHSMSPNDPSTRGYNIPRRGMEPTNGQSYAMPGRPMTGQIAGAECGINAVPLNSLPSPGGNGISRIKATPLAPITAGDSMPFNAQRHLSDRHSSGIPSPLYSNNGSMRVPTLDAVAHQNPVKFPEMMNQASAYENVMLSRGHNAQFRNQVSHSQARQRKQSVQSMRLEQNRHQIRQYFQSPAEREANNVQEGGIGPRIDSLTQIRQSQQNSNMQQNMHNPDMSPRSIASPLSYRPSHQRGFLGQPQQGYPVQKMQAMISASGNNASQLFTHNDLRNYAMRMEDENIEKTRGTQDQLFYNLHEVMRRYEAICKNRPDLGPTKILEDLKKAYILMQKLRHNSGNGPKNGTPDVRRLEECAMRLIDQAKKTMAQMESPLSNTSTANPPLIDHDDAIQESPFMTEAGHQQGTPLDHGLQPKALERAENSRRLDISPAESSNLHRHQQKDRNEDDGLKRPQFDPFAAISGHGVRQEKTGQSLNQTLASKHQESGRVNKILTNKNLPYEIHSKETGRKRVSGRDINAIYEKDSRRKVEYSSVTPTINGSEWKTLQNRLPHPTEGAGEITPPKEVEKEIVEEKEINDEGAKSVLNSHEDEAEGLEFESVDNLLKQFENWEEGVSWYCPEIEDEIDENHHEWKFERTVLESLTTSKTIQISESASTSTAGKIFQVEDSNYIQDLNNSSNLDESKESRSDASSDLEKELETTALMEKVKAECNELLEQVDIPGELTYHTFVEKSERICDRKSHVILDYKDLKRVMCDMKVMIDMSYPDSLPSISFSNTATSLGNERCLRHQLLSKMVDEDITSVPRILQLWTELTMESKTTATTRTASNTTISKN